ncbi:MAG: response regulator, partial [Gammaproteobacteria bacterium]
MQKKALVVDDSKLALFVLKKMLLEESMAVDTAETAEEALGYLVHNKPDVIFLDHSMPGMDGLQALKIIKENPDTATIPIMMYTSKEGEVYMSQARALGAVDILP